MLDALDGALARQPHDAALGLQWGDGVHSQFDRLLDQPVHLVAAGDALGERDGIARFGIGLCGIGQAGGRIAAVDGIEPGAKLLARAVEQADIVADSQAQHMDMARDAFRQRDSGVGGKR